MTVLFEITIFFSKKSFNHFFVIIWLVRPRRRLLIKNLNRLLLLYYLLRIYFKSSQITLQMYCHQTAVNVNKWFVVGTHNMQQQAIKEPIRLGNPFDDVSGSPYAQG